MAENLSRAFLLRWLDSIGVHTKRVEDVGTGVPLCACLKQLNNRIGKYKEHPTNEWEYLDNLRLVKEYFAAEGTKVHLPIDRMCKLKLQDNLEVLQWFYKYYNSQGQSGHTQTTKPPEHPSGVEITEVGAVVDPAGTEKCRRPPCGDAEECAKNKALLKKFAKILKNERDFYFGKLIAIEEVVLGMEADDLGCKDKLLEILYEDSATEEVIE